MDMTMPLDADLPNVPLRVALTQLPRGYNLDFFVRNGAVYITSWNDVLAISIVYDKCQRVGHCMISLLMAFVRAAAAGFVFSPPGSRSPAMTGTDRFTGPSTRG